MGSKPKQLEISAQGCGPVGMRETGCDALNICNTELQATGSLGSTGQKHAEVKLGFAWLHSWNA